MLMETLTPEMIATLVNNGLGGVAIIMLFNVSNKISRITERQRDHETRLRTIERRLLPAAFIGCALMLGGCDIREVKTSISDAATGAATGFLSGGPLGAIVGGITAAISGGFAIKKHRQAQRRGRIVDHYRRTAGDLTSVQLAKIKEGIVMPG